MTLHGGGTRGYAAAQGRWSAAAMMCRVPVEWELSATLSKQCSANAERATHEVCTDVQPPLLLCCCSKKESAWQAASPGQDRNCSCGPGHPWYRATGRTTYAADCIPVCMPLWSCRKSTATRAL